MAQLPSRLGIDRTLLEAINGMLFVLIMQGTLMVSGGCQRGEITPRNTSTAMNSVLDSTSFEVVPAIIDVGSVDPQSSHPLQFTLRNAGNVAIREVVIESGCGCLAIDETKFGLMPAQVRVVRLKLVAPSSVGGFYKEVKIHHGGRAVAAVGIVGRVATSRKLVAFPDRIDLGRIDANGRKDFEVRLEHEDGSPLLFESAESEVPAIKVVTVQSEHPESCKVKLQVDTAGLPAGFMTSRVVLRAQGDSPFNMTAITVRFEVRSHMYGVRPLFIVQTTPGGTAHIPVFVSHHEASYDVRPMITGVVLEDESGGRLPKIQAESSGEEVIIVVDDSHESPKVIGNSGF